MNYRVKMSAEQMRAVAEWAALGDGFADVLLDDGDDDDRIVVGQGDERVAFNVDGVRCCERCGALDGEELQGDACYSCGLGHDDDPEGGETLGDREAGTWNDADGSTCQHCDSTIPPEREHCPTCGRRSEMLNDVAPVDRETTMSERIARHARELLDPDYDPAAEDDDGVPLYSDETRAAAQADPRGERDR